jgi:DNA polymerase III epsilon subunit-like protein
MYLFLDTETTGLPLRYDAPPSQVGNWPRLVQIAWLLTDKDGHELAARSFIIRPDGFVIPDDAVRVHGITTEIARRRGVDVRSALDTLSEDLSRAQLLVAHNVEFDNGVVGAEFYRAGHGANPLDALPRYCTMRESTELCQIPGGPYGVRTRRPALRGWKWPTLDQLHHTLFRERFQVSHEGLADARACARCFFELMRLDALPENDVDDDYPMQVQSLFDDIYGYAEECDWFDATFVDDVYDQFEERGCISEGQLTALESIRDMLASRTE